MQEQIDNILGRVPLYQLFFQLVSHKVPRDLDLHADVLSENETRLLECLGLCFEEPNHLLHQYLDFHQEQSHHAKTLD